MKLNPLSDLNNSYDSTSPIKQKTCMKNCFSTVAAQSGQEDCVIVECFVNYRN